MNIAVLLSGFPRSMEYAYEFNKSYYENLSSNIDFFIHTYDYNSGYYEIDKMHEMTTYGEYGKTKADFIHDVKQKLIKLYNPKEYKISTFDEMDSWNKERIHLIGDFGKVNLIVDYSLGKLYSLKQNYEISKNYIDKYDVVILTKLDQVFYSEDFDKLKKFYENIKNNSIYVSDLRVHKFGIKAQQNFLMGKPDTIHKFFENYDEKIYKIHQPDHTPDRIAYWCFKRNLPYWCMFSDVDMRVVKYSENHILRKEIQERVNDMTFHEIKKFDDFYESQKIIALKNRGGF